MGDRRWLLATCALLFACSSNGSGRTDGAVVADRTGRTEQTVADLPTKPCANGEAVNACPASGACKAMRDCSAAGSDLNGSCHSGICVPDPATEAQVEVSAGKWEPADLSCLTTPPTLPAGPTTATLWGRVLTFGLKEVTTGVTVEIFDPKADPDLKTPLGSTVSAPPVASGTCSPVCTGQLCVNDRCVDVKDSEQNDIGFFEIPNIPTNKLLVIRTKKTGLVTTLQYNLWVPADKLKNGKDRLDAFTITEQTKKVLPPLAGITGIAAGNAALAGEIHDCKDRMVKGAKVALSVRPQKLAYFDGKEQPSPTQNETHQDGLYAALNVRPPASGEVELAASALSGGKTVTLARFGAKIFPDAITILTTLPWYPGQP